MAPAPGTNREACDGQAQGTQQAAQQQPEALGSAWALQRTNRTQRQPRQTKQQPGTAHLQGLQQAIGGDELECVISDDLKSELWHKYIVNCSYNTITAYYKCATRGLLDPPSRLEELDRLIEEAIAVGKADGAKLPDNLKEIINNQFLHERNLDTTSSMAADVINGRRTEIETFGGHLTRLAKKLGVPVPESERFYTEMKKLGL